MQPDERRIPNEMEHQTSFFPHLCHQRRLEEVSIHSIGKERASPIETSSGEGWLLKTAETSLQTMKRYIFVSVMNVTVYFKSRFITHLEIENLSIFDLVVNLL